MKMTRTALVSLLVLLLGGCATAHRILGGDVAPTATNVCPDPRCQVEVTVSKTTSGCKADVDIHRLKVTFAGEVRIIWNIAGDGEFVDRAGTGDGIDIKGDGAFHGRLRNPKNFKWDFKNEDRGRGIERKYDVNTKLGAATCRLDPFVIN